MNRFFEQFVVFYFYVGDLQRALEFYEGKLGFRRVYFNDEDLHWAELSFGTHGRPHLGLNRWTHGGEVPRNASGIPSFEVQDMEGLKAEVERRGIPHKGIIDYNEYMQFLWVLDPDGNKIEFIRLKQGRLP